MHTLSSLGALALCLSTLTLPAHAVTAPEGKAAIVQLAEHVADYQIANLAAGLAPAHSSWDTGHPDGWVQGVLLIGVTALAEHSAAPRYRQFILARGQANGWAVKPGPFADNHAIAQSYLWAARHGADAAALLPLRASFDAILAHPPVAPLDYTEEDQRKGGPGCLERWCWSDALFMSPPVWLELARATGERRYADYAKAEFNATTAFLYDGAEQLYYRDSRFFSRRNAIGKKVFWSRGNGWVFAGLARMLALLPADDPERPRMATIFRQMAARLAALQKPDGYWSASLLDAPEGTPPESSGTALHVFAMASGVRQGLLPAASFDAPIRRGWRALAAAVHPDGKLGWVQQVSDRPEQVGYDDSQYYGVGAFLLAATAVADLRP